MFSVLVHIRSGLPSLFTSAELRRFNFSVVGMVRRGAKLRVPAVVFLKICSESSWNSFTTRSGRSSPLKSLASTSYLILDSSRSNTRIESFRGEALKEMFVQPEL